MRHAYDNLGIEDEMTQNEPGQSGKNTALPLLLGIVLIVVLGIGGWLFLKKAPMPQTEQPLVTDITTEEPMAAESDHVMAEPDASVPEAEVPAEAAPEMSAPAVPVSIDVTKALAPRTYGNAEAPVKIIEYASLTCSHCAHFFNDTFPELKAKYIDTGKVFFEYRDFPLNDPALKASIAARCLPEDKYEGFISLLYKTQDHWAGTVDYMASLRQNAKLAGMSDETFDACQAEKKIQLGIADGMQAAQDKWKISATPTFIVNDGAETISGAVPLTEFERVFRKVTNNAVGDAPKVE